eukprot:1133214-Lingulodinium_polyedra.AAC.1
MSPGWETLAYRNRCGSVPARLIAQRAARMTTNTVNARAHERAKQLWCRAATTASTLPHSAAATATTCSRKH